MVSVMIAVISTPYSETRCWAARTIQLSTLSRRSASSRSDSPIRTTVSAMRVRSVLEGSSTPSSTSLFSVFHAVAAASAISSRAISCSFTASARAMGSGWCCRLAAHLVGEVHQLAVDAVADEMVDESRRPARRVTLDHPLDDLAGVQRPLKRPIGQQLDQGLLPVLGEQGAQHPPHGRAPLRVGD